MSEEHPFRCKRCKNEYDSLSEIYKHLEDIHNKNDVEYLPKSSEKCKAVYHFGLSSYRAPLPCKLMIGHLGSHQYEEPFLAQQQVNRIQHQGWIIP